MPPGVVLIGNLAPVDVMMQGGDRQTVITAANSLLKAMEPFPNFILSSGCDLPMETPLDNIKAMAQAVRLHKP